MKLRLPHRLIQALLTTCAATLTSTSPAFAEVPEGYTEVFITDANQLANYTATDYTAFIIGSDITDDAYRMTGYHQYWGDKDMRSHVLTFAGLTNYSWHGGAISIYKELITEKFHEVRYSFNSTTYSSSGGAIYGSDKSTITYIGNEAITFNENYASSSTYISQGGAICMGSNSSLAFINNEDVTFSGNYAFSSPYHAEGGAIYGWNGSTINLQDNGNITFSANYASSIDSSSSGGAISSYRNNVNVARNKTIVFSENSVSFQGGAIYSQGSNMAVTDNNAVVFTLNSAGSGGAIAAAGTHLEMTGNNSIEFSYNTATSFGGAISASSYISEGSTVDIYDNGNVVFCGNSSNSAGGAIRSDRNSILNFSSNESLSFNENHSDSSGGAIYASDSSVIYLMGNDNVIFSGNSTSNAGARGGAIYITGGSLNISYNEYVEFRGNYEKGKYLDQDTYCLRSVYGYSGTLQFSAAEGKNITFYDTLYADSTSTVSFNTQYQDKDGIMQNATGDIVFSGMFVEEDLRKLKPNHTQQELADSLTTEVYSTTNLYGGRLRIEDGAVYKGNGVIVATDSGATLRLSNGTLDQVGYDVTLNSGTTLAVQGVNSITAATLDMQSESILSFTLGETNLTTAAVTHTGAFKQGGALNIQLADDGTIDDGKKYSLLTMTSGEAPDSWDTTKITVTGLKAKLSDLSWENGTLYFTTPTPPDLLTATWSGYVSSKWNTTEKNWVQGEFEYRYKDGVNVVFGDTASGEIELEGILSPKNVLVENSVENNYTFIGEGAIAGAATLTKEGTGTLTISTSNTYEGGTFINGGVVVVDNATALGSGNVALNGAELDIATDATISGQITVDGDNYLIVENGHTLSLGNRITNNYYLEMWGTYDISNLSAEVLESEFVGGAVKGNGFVSNELQVQVVDNGFGAYADMDYASFVYNGFEGEVGYEGEVKVTTVDDSAFHVNSGTDKVSKAFKNYSPASILMKNGTGLDLDKSGADIPNIKLAADILSVSLNVQQDTTIDFITGGNESSILIINGTLGKTLSLMDASGYNGSLALSGGAVAAGSATAFGTSNITLSDTSLDLGGFEVANAMDLEGNTTIGNGTLTGSLSVYNTTLHVGSNATVNGTLTTDGTSSIEVSQDTTLTMGKVVQNIGQLALSGTFDISALSSVAREPEYIGGITAGNGFYATFRDITVVNNTQGGTSDLTNATFIYKGETVASVSGGTVCHTSVDYSRFYVFTGEECVGAALDAASAAGAELEGITMSAGTTLHVDRDMSADFVSAASGSIKLDIQGSSTVTEGATPHSEFTLTGSGVYALASGNASLAPSLDFDWIGAVGLKDVVMNNPDFLDLDNYGHDGSSVRLNGVKANFGAESNEFASTLELVGAGLEITACQGNRSYEFLGGVKGGGNLTYNLSTPAHNQTYIFSGDISDWTGAYVSAAANKTSTLEFAGDATVMGADIVREQGIINVVVGNGTEELTTVFKRDMQASNLTVNENAKAVIEGNAVIEKTANRTGVLSLQGALEVANGGSLSLSQDAAVQVGDNYTFFSTGGTVPALSNDLEITKDVIQGTGVSKGQLDNVSMSISADLLMERVTISGSLIDVGEGTTLYLVNVDIKSSTHITDDPASVFVQVTHAELDKTNTWVDKEITTAADTTLYLCGDTAKSITLAAGSEIVELTSSMFDSVTLTGTDLWLDMTGIAEFTYNKDYFILDFQDLARDMARAQVDVEILHVYATLDGERYTEAYSTANGGLTTTLYFQVPEPATSTLSLLALTALAARRKKK